MKSIEVSSAVKDAVLRSLLSSYGRMSKDTAVERRVSGKIDWLLYGSDKIWAWNGSGKGTTELILMWHIGTRLFEMKSTTASPEMIAASHLSNYCAYLVAAVPELLPDCAAWTKKRYEEVAKDVKAALGADVGGCRSMSTPEKYQRLLIALSHDSRDSVLQRGAEIGQHLVEEYAEDQASACRILRRCCSTWRQQKTSRVTWRPWRAAASSSRSSGHCSSTPATTRPEIPGPGRAIV